MHRAAGVLGNMSKICDPRFRPFKVVKKIRESANITSFYLEPLNPGHWQVFEAGQFLTLRIPHPSGDAPIVRNYTVSSSPAETAFYRITVKREASLKPELPDGVGSLWLHDNVEEGALLQIDGPRGAFKLDSSSDRPVILLSGGVGLTPAMSMLKVLATQSDRRVWFIHACDSGNVHALKAETDQLAASRGGIEVHYCYRFPSAQDVSGGGFHSSGFVTRQTLQGLLPLDDYEVYMCGPPPFMQAMYDLLTGLGIDRKRIAYEFFGPASLLAPAAANDAKVAKPAPEEPIADTSNGGLTVKVQETGRELIWDDTSESLLSFLEARGVEPPFSCRVGVCSGCLQGLVSGEVEYIEDPLDEVPEGKILLCCSRPRSSVVLDLANA
ncbi:FAD-binding oxidoreductase [Rhizobium grahamii]|uniref:nitric oxide dioxygenase n=1 Tax=Rhizobium grahamii CCGE 502 TaxID=990285 RepID=S3HBX2_9HYPH|nr:FAD-binding oxidoreductase [Rhizobium grahamii]EPE96099.1 flavohemoprotein [Rhizobium grahamii CCGE 502]